MAQDPFLGFCSHDEPFDPRLPLVARWERLDGSREQIEARGLRWFQSVVQPRLDAKVKTIITLGQAADRPRGDFNVWAAWLVNAFRGRGIVWDYWNEPDLQLFWDWPNPREYVAAARDLRSKIASGETLLLGSLSTFDARFFEGMLGAGCDSFASGYSLHPYGPDPGGQVKHMRAYTANSIYCTERGNSDPSAQLADLQSSRKAVVAAGALCHIWYRWPCGSPQDDSFQNGVINPDGSPRPVLAALLAQASAATS